MITASAIKAKLARQWQQYKFQKSQLANESLFPLRISIAKLNEKTLMNQYAEFQTWQQALDRAFADVAGFELIKQGVNYPKIGRQRLPIALQINDIQALARYLGKWQRWQLVEQKIDQLKTQLPLLRDWLNSHPGEVEQHLTDWSTLIAVCQYLKARPQPMCYIRQLSIAGVDSKFIERHKGLLKTLLDICLDPADINWQHTKLQEFGFEKRFGFKYDQPLVRMRLLDPALCHEFSGLSDISMPIEQFEQLDLMLDRVFITENKLNFLVFPELKNSLVIFGAGYAVQMLQQARWLDSCQVYYWGDIDTHGLAILSQFRGYFSHIKGMLMDSDTLLAHQSYWGKEPANKAHKGDQLAHLTETEQQLYQDLKQHRWQANLRLEQEHIDYQRLADWLGRLK